MVQISHLTQVAKAIGEATISPQEISTIYDDGGQPIVLTGQDKDLVEAIYGSVDIPSMTLRAEILVPGHKCFLEFTTDYNESGLTVYMDVRLDGLSFSDMCDEKGIDYHSFNEDWFSYADDLWRTMLKHGHTGEGWEGTSFSEDLQERIDLLVAAVASAKEAA